MRKDKEAIKAFDIVAVVVLYDKELKESDTFNSIAFEDYKSIIVWNNGPREITNKDFYNTQIINCCENKSLGYIYNYCMDSYNFDYLLVLDDDTKLPKGYVSTAIPKMESKTDVIIPQCSNGKSIISPTRMFPWWLMSSYIDAVMSGIFVSKNIEIKFNEKLPLYGVDKEFLYRAQKNRKKISYIDCTLNHNNSFETEEDKLSLLRRRKLLIYSQLNMIKVSGNFIEKFYFSIKFLKNYMTIVILKT